MSIQITINGGDASEALKELSALAAGISGQAAAPASPAMQAVPVDTPAAPVQGFYTPPVQQPSAAPPTQPGYGQQPPVQTGAVPTTGMAPDPAQSQQPPAPTGVPTSTQSYTLEQLAVAATPLMDSGKQAELVQLLQQFGVQSLTHLPKDRYGEFATALRGLGARI